MLSFVYDDELKIVGGSIYTENTCLSSREGKHQKWEGKHIKQGTQVSKEDETSSLYVELL